MSPSRTGLMPRLFRPALLFTLLVAVPAGAKSAVPPAAPTAKAWADMDYGPFMSMTLEAPAPAGNFAYKAIVVPLRPDRSAAMCFDTDLLRWSAGWHGPRFIDWHNVLYDGSHTTHCKIVGEQVFGTRKLPGWAKPGSESFDDPREFPFGPMPRESAQWKGLYRVGDRVILSYRIGDADVLELADFIERDGLSIFARRLQIGPRRSPLLAAVSDTPGVSAELVGTGAKLLRDGDHCRLSVPAGETPLDVSVFVALDTGDARSAEAFKRLVLAAPPPKGNLADATGGGPSLYKPIVTMREPAANEAGPFAVDTLPTPTDNPWRALVRPGGLDFFEGGKRAAICTWDGDVWVVDGIAGESGDLTWTRFATGLFQPLGLVIKGEQVYVLGRDQITRLHDLNADGEADFYEAFNHDAQVTAHFHEFAMDLQLASNGDFYYMKGACHAKAAEVPQHGTLIRVSADGSKSEIVCSGFRAPNGLAIGKTGQFFTTDQQGHWTPANRVNLIEPGKFYGYNLAYLPRQKPQDGGEPPALWLHPTFDRSPAQPLFVDSEKWGPLNGKMLLSSYGTGDLELILTETVQGKTQGAAVKLPLPKSPTGIMRGRFNPADGQLYLCGLFGWAGDRPQAGGLYRVRYTGKPLRTPIDFHATKTGLTLTFAEPLNAELAADPDSYAVSRWNYRRTADYGSPDLRVSDGKPGRDTVKVESAKVSKDGRTVELKLTDMRPAMQLQVQYNLEDGEGKAVKGELQATVHALGDAAPSP
jgi:glucose/arabinose dehydrogenase